MYQMKKKILFLIYEIIIIFINLFDINTKIVENLQKILQNSVNFRLLKTNYMVNYIVGL